MEPRFIKPDRQAFYRGGQAAGAAVGLWAVLKAAKGGAVVP
ncbi:hypothetical protein [Pedobacter nanyangensis]|nr:hypothetical protein [Pedobacter nanyangensis]